MSYSRDKYPTLAFYDREEKGPSDECAQALDEIDNLRFKLEAAQLTAVTDAVSARLKTIAATFDIERKRDAFMAGWRCDGRLSPEAAFDRWMNE